MWLLVVVEETEKNVHIYIKRLEVWRCSPHRKQTKKVLKNIMHVHGTRHVGWGEQTVNRRWAWSERHSVMFMYRKSIVRWNELTSRLFTVVHTLHPRWKALWQLRQNQDKIEGTWEMIDILQWVPILFKWMEDWHWTREKRDKKIKWQLKMGIYFKISANTGRWDASTTRSVLTL